MGFNSGFKGLIPVRQWHQDGINCSDWQRFNFFEISNIWNRTLHLPTIFIAWSAVKNTLHNKRKYKTQPSHSENLTYSIIYLTMPPSNRLLFFLRRTNTGDLESLTFLRTAPRLHVCSKCLYVLLATFDETWRPGDQVLIFAAWCL